MAQRRMISKSISTSTKLAEVSTFSKLLFTWLIPHCDDHGHVDGTPKIIKGLVVPLCDETIDDIQKSLEELEKNELIRRYEVNGRTYIEIEKWFDHQTLKSDRPATLRYPNPDLGIPTEPMGNPRVDVGKNKLSEVKLSEVKILFDRLWKIYPKKIGKGAAERAFVKIRPSEVMFKEIIASVENHKKTMQWREDAGRFIPHLATFLNQKRWEDELVPEGNRFKDYSKK